MKTIGNSGNFSVRSDYNRNGNPYAVRIVYAHKDRVIGDASATTALGGIKQALLGALDYKGKRRNKEIECLPAKEAFKRINLIVFGPSEIEYQEERSDEVDLLARKYAAHVGHLVGLESFDVCKVFVIDTATSTRVIYGDKYSEYNEVGEITLEIGGFDRALSLSLEELEKNSG